MVARIRHVNESVRPHRQPGRELELAGCAAFRTPLVDTRRSEGHHPVITRIGDIDVAGGVNSHPHRISQRTDSWITQLGRISTIGFEHLNTVVVGIGYINKTVTRNGHLGGPRKLAVARPRRPPRKEENAVQVENHDPVVARVRDINFTGCRIDGQPGGHAEGAQTGGRTVPSAQEIAVRVEDLYLASIGIPLIDVAACVNRDRRGPVHGVILDWIQA